MATTHHFNAEIAAKYGVNQAIMLENIYFWVTKNAANGTHFHDGYYWTYNSATAFQKLFPYWTARQIEGILKKLKENDLIYTGRYNENKFTHQTWYTLTENGMSLYTNCEIDLLKNVNGKTQKRECITDIYNITNNNTDEKQHIEKTYSVCDGESFAPQVVELNFNETFEMLKSYYPKKDIGVSNARKIIKNLFEKGFTDNQKNVVKANHHLVSLAIRNYANECEAKEFEERFIKNFDNFLSNHLADYYEKSKDNYIDGMKNKYGINWDKVKFRYL